MRKRPLLIHRNLLWRMPKGLIFLGIFMLCVGGCANVARRDLGFACPTCTINDAPYFALIDMCKAEGLTWDYDPLSQIVILKRDRMNLKLLIGSSKIIINGGPGELSKPVVIKDSIIYAPPDLRNYVYNSEAGTFEKGKLAPPVALRSVNFVVLDAGHGGKDPGAIGKRGLKEKSVVLDVANRIKEELEKQGLKVYMTRTKDRFIQLDERSRIANEKGADLFVSIHANANRSRWREGFEVYYVSEDIDDDARALAAAENPPRELEKEDYLRQPSSLKAIIWDMIYTENRKESIELAGYICNAVSDKMSLKMLGVKGAPFAVLKGARMPAVLVEIGYLSNGEGEKKLGSSAYRREIAQAIASGIINFKKYSQGEVR